MAARLIYLLGLFLAVWWLPWWLVLLCGLAGIVRYHHFYEVLLPALCFDLLYAAPGVTWLGFQFAVSALSLVLVYVLEDFKARIRLS